ncbi:hypothetical protein BD779DRAFT_1557839 [Infundibulicybe gibba]|nr:hypothetical protein BD779DRAFT_1557839 [Infundibulicybe gibba]
MPHSRLCSTESATQFTGQQRYWDNLIMEKILELVDLTIDSEILVIPPLPSEIVDLVIDQLRTDEKTLKACNLLSSPLCTIQPHVRGIKLSIDMSDTAPMATCIQELVNGGSNLLSLSMKTVRGGGMTLVDDHLQALLSTPILKNLRHLKLMYLRFNSPNDSIGLFSSLPALESLVLYGVDSCIKDVRNTYTMSPPPNLRHLFIWTIGIPHELCWLTVHPRHPLTTLHLHNITSTSHPIVLNYLRRSSQLQCLSFDFSDRQTHARFLLNFMTQIDLTSQKDLRCLRLRSCQIVPLFSNLLPRVCPPHIEEITISTCGRRPPGTLAWADLSKVFTSPSVRGLKHLYVDEAHIRDVLEALPEFASRGIILPLHKGEFEHTTTRLSLPAALY